jgi:GNAT superfamily N-acetyltransferase
VISRLDHVQVAAPPGGEPVARAFYGELLGLDELPKPEPLRARGGVWFAVGDQQLHVGIEESFAERLERAGHAVTWDGPRIYAADPFGNRLELIGPHAGVTVRPLRDDERAWAAATVRESWGSDIVIGGGRELRPAELPALVAEADGVRAGLATYEITDRDCELVSLDALTIGAGIGSALVEAVADVASAAGCTRLQVITTNDNLPALRLYQRHGFVLAAVHPGAVDLARRRKPEISATGHAGIPIRDELELLRAL